MLECSKCKIRKNYNDFWKKNGTKRGYFSRCKECNSLDKKIKKEKDPEKFKEKTRKYNQNKTKEKRYKWHRNYYTKDIEKTREQRRKYTNTDEFRKRRRELSKLTYSKNKEFRKKTVVSPEKAKCRSRFYHQVRIGNIIRPTECSKCGKKETKIQGHHTDYTKPFDVIWLCTVCHGFEHKKYKIT